MLAGLADLLDPPVTDDAWVKRARPQQLPPLGRWLVWLILAGRGWGKTRTGAEYVRACMLAQPGARVALVGSIFADGRDTMVEGESGLLSILDPADLRGGSRDSAWNRTIGELFLANGSRCNVYSSEKPRRLRGPQHHYAWCDELAQWTDADQGDAEGTTWANLMLGLRLGADPRCVVTSTPRPVKLLKGTTTTEGLIVRATTTVTRGSTYDNLDNLAPTFRQQVLDRYEGTRLGRQELYAELLEDVEGALWNQTLIDPHRVDRGFVNVVRMARVVVAVDPAITSTDESDETGIVVAGTGEGRGYVLADLTCRESPGDWAQAAVTAYRVHGADRIVAEANQGGDMVRHTIATVDPSVPVTLVHASRGKQARAEPVVALYEQGKISHLGSLPELEDQMTSWVPTGGASPDRVDALVWAFTELMIGGAGVGQSTYDTHRALAGRR